LIILIPALEDFVNHRITIKLEGLSKDHKDNIAKKKVADCATKNLVINI
jgi:hypothetical protein